MHGRSLTYRDHREDPGGWARELGVPLEAVEVYLACEVVDLHSVSFVWTRVLPGYNLSRRHRPRLPHSAFLNQVDLPRLREAHVAAVSWDIPTNPLRRTGRRVPVTRRNIARVAEALAEFPEEYAVATNLRDYRAARARGLTAGFVSLQGGDAVGSSLEELDRLSDIVHRITLVELTRSRIGAPSGPRRRPSTGLTSFGSEYVRRMQANKILVDLAHLNRRGFADALEVADPSIPVVVTHTGLNAVRPLWRNIDDDQVKAVAERGGTVGILFHRGFLTAGRRCPVDAVVDHIEHVVRVTGEDFVSLGSDLDGMISLPDGFEDVTHLPKVVANMLERRWSTERIKKVMGENALRVIGAVRP